MIMAGFTSCPRASLLIKFPSCLGHDESQAPAHESSPGDTAVDQMLACFSRAQTPATRLGNIVSHSVLRKVKNENLKHTETRAFRCPTWGESVFPERILERWGPSLAPFGPDSCRVTSCWTRGPGRWERQVQAAGSEPGIPTVRPLSTCPLRRRPRGSARARARHHALLLTHPGIGGIPGVGASCLHRPLPHAASQPAEEGRRDPHGHTHLLLSLPGCTQSPV